MSGGWGLARRCVHVVALVAGLLVALSGPAVALATPQDDLNELNAHLATARRAIGSGDVAAARAAYAAYDARWLEVEDGVKAVSRPAYRAIEDAMSDVKIALRTEPVDLARVDLAMLELEARGRAFSQNGTSNQADGVTDSAPDGSNQARLIALIAHLDRVAPALQTGDAPAAAAALRDFQRAWPDVEGLIHVRSPAVYASTENDMAEAYALLISSPPDTRRALLLVEGMKTQLQPFASQASSYGVFDAAVIMLREGLEALLVISALLAFLSRSGRPNERRWIWVGSGVGVALSIVVAFTAQALFSRAGAALGQELVEGIVGLLAAVMLFYVSYWLHQKSRLGAWQRYIKEQGTAALARNSVFSLATIAFLAVFREGAETAMFYLGIAPSISLTDLAAGMGVGLALLLAIGFGLLTLGLRLPLRPFFLASSLLIYYLGFKFVGTGIHALQVAGVLAATPAPLPANEVLGLFPTWQTTLPQLALLGIGMVVLAYSVRHRERTPLKAT